MSSPAILSSEESQETTLITTNTADSNIQAPSPTHTPTPRPSTPDAPPYSPLTPTLPPSQLPDPPSPSHLTPSPKSRRVARSSTLPQPNPRPLIPSIPAPPPPVPISESTNTDAVALRAALDVLQIQRLRAVGDIHTLREMKERALEDPQGFAERVARGEVSAERRGVELRVPRMGDLGESEERERDEGEMRADEEVWTLLPQPQDVVRCPPVNWAKYHVVEGVLDVLHEEQRRRPEDGRRGMGVEEKPEHVVMAPYRPFVDGKGVVSPKGSGRKRSG